MFRSCHGGYIVKVLQVLKAGGYYNADDIMKLCTFLYLHVEDPYFHVTLCNYSCQERSNFLGIIKFHPQGEGILAFSKITSTVAIRFTNRLKNGRCMVT